MRHGPYRLWTYWHMGLVRRPIRTSIATLAALAAMVLIVLMVIESVHAAQRQSPLPVRVVGEPTTAVIGSAMHCRSATTPAARLTCVPAAGWSAEWLAGGDGDWAPAPWWPPSEDAATPAWWICAGTPETWTPGPRRCTPVDVKGPGK